MSVGQFAVDIRRKGRRVYLRLLWVFSYDTFPVRKGNIVPHTQLSITRE